jgi:hypothetical protein
MTPPAHERKTRHTKSDLAKFFADRPDEFGHNKYAKDHPGAFAHENWVQFIWRVFKEEVKCAVEKETELERQSSESESPAPYGCDVGTETKTSHEDRRRRSLLDDSINARKACSFEAIERTGIRSLLEKEDQMTLKHLIGGTFVKERSQLKNAMRKERIRKERKRERCDSPSHDSGEGRPLTKRQHLPLPATGFRRFIVLKVVLSDGELDELTVVDTSIESTRPWQKVLNAISDPNLNMERALGYTPAVRTNPSGCACLPDGPADGITMFECDVSARRVLSLPPAG